ncbi:MAG: phasin family protein [Bradyrhizobiaceae bacterium]|nr:phasin family protein [Bradyrhizobiaceae bacterium]
MSVIETLAQQELEQSPALQPRAQVDNAEAVFNSLSVEAENDLRVLGDQLLATSACARQLGREWFAFADRSVMNGFEFLQKLARTETPTDALVLQRDFAQVQIAAMRDCWNRCGRLALAGAAECACEK